MDKGPASDGAKRKISIKKPLVPKNRMPSKGNADKCGSGGIIKKTGKRVKKE
jgi:hypothetical protein